MWRISVCAIQYLIKVFQGQEDEMWWFIYSALRVRIQLIVIYHGDNDDGNEGD